MLAQVVQMVAKCMTAKDLPPKLMGKRLLHLTNVKQY